MGWNGSNGSMPKPIKKAKAPSASRGLLAGLVVVALACVGLFFVLSGDKKETPAQKNENKQGTIKEVKPAPVAPASIKESEIDKEKKALERERQKRRELFKKMTPDERLAYLFEEMKKRPIRDEPSSNRIFRTGLEQVMDWVFSCEVGAPPPLLPQISMFDKAHLVEILLMDNPIKETDSERAKMAKENVQLAKKEFCNFIKEGGDPDDFLPYYHGQLVAAHQEWSMSRKSALEMLKTDPDIALEYVERINTRLAEKGIKPIQLPPKLLERYGISPEE